MPTSRRRTRKRQAVRRSGASRPPNPDGFDDRARQVVCETSAAEAAGDPALALRIHESLPPFQSSPHSHVLRMLVELGDAAPGWLWSRWMTIQAHRGDLAGANDAPEPALARAIDAAYVHGVDLHRHSDLPPEMFGASLFQFDWIVRQLRVYESGELRQLVENRASARLIDRADRILDWLDAPMRGLQLTENPAGPSLVFTDLATGEPVRLLDLGLACEHEIGTSFIGRVVATDVDPGLMWEWMPLCVDQPTAVEVAALAGVPDLWVDSLARAHRERRLAGMYSWHDDMTPASDISCKAFIGLFLERQLPSLPRRPDGMVQLDTVAVSACANALRAVRADQGAAADIGPMVASALVWPGVFDLLKSQLARPQLADAWQSIAHSLPEPARGRAEELAALGRGRPAA